MSITRSVLNSTSAEARHRVIGLYRAWYRDIPYICETFTLPVGVKDCRLKLKEFFMRNKDVSDIRVVDMLVAKGQLELEETHAIWKQKSHVMRFFEDPAGPKQPKDFMTKFLAGSE
eukprot:gene659-1065_t